MKQDLSDFYDTELEAYVKRKVGIIQNSLEDCQSPLAVVTKDFTRLQPLTFLFPLPWLLRKLTTFSEIAR